jgi:hypothetical protein
MGFTPRSTVYRLQFDGTDYDGLEVSMRAAKLGALLDTGELVAIGQRIGPNSAPTAADMDRFTSEFEDLAAHLVSWNVEDDNGKPIPADIEGLKTLEMPLVIRIGQEWQRAMGDVAAPLSSSSNSGRPPDALSMPMEPLAASLAS